MTTGLQLAYRPGHITRPSIGALFAFWLRGEAEEFMNNSTYAATLFKAEAERYKEDRTMCSDAFHSLEEINRFWSSKELGACRMPSGTVLCSWIKLLERLD
jgi:hypothetical protein